MPGCQIRNQPGHIQDEFCRTGFPNFKATETAICTLHTCSMFLVWALWKIIKIFQNYTSLGNKIVLFHHHSSKSFIFSFMAQVFNTLVQRQIF